MTGRGGMRQVKSLPQRFCTALHRSSLCFLSSSSVTSCPRHNRQSAIFHTPIIGRRHLARTSVSLTPPLMTDFAPGLRHHILMEYLPHSHDHSFAALAQRYNVKGGKRTVQRWYDRWDGTTSTSAAQIHQHITQPILARNRSHRPVHYDELWQSTKASTGTDLSLTVQRYGKEITRARDKATRAWTAAERTCSYT